MPGLFDNDLLREGILRLRLKEYDSARRYLQRALEASDDMETRSEANYYLSRMAEDPREKRRYLEETLAVNMTHVQARRDLAILEGKIKENEVFNPDSAPAFVEEPPKSSAFVEEPQPVKADRFTCPKCGARMVFAPDGVSLICEHCQRSEKLTSPRAGEENDFFLAMANGKGHKTVLVKPFKCQGCGASFTLAPNEVSATCAYCGSVHVVALEQMRDLLEPDAVIPMAFDQKQASACLVDWIDKNHIQLQSKVPIPHGLYLPVWTFDLAGNLPWNGKVIKEKRVVPVSGEKAVTFSNLAIPAGRTLSSLLKDCLPAFDFSSAVAYDPRFLAGWPAEIYERSMADASLDARSLAVSKVRHEVLAEYGQVTDMNYSTSSMMVSAFRLVMAPVWVTQVITREQRGRLLINGQNGSIFSELRVRRLSGLFDRILGS